jgi:hypothetical protein
MSCLGARSAALDGIAGRKGVLVKNNCGLMKVKGFLMDGMAG